MSERTPPRFVPTLTTVVELPADPVAAREAAATAAPAQAVALGPHAMLSDADLFRLEEQLLHRVLQRIDLSLEERLSDTVSAAIQQQLDDMIPRLRNEIEAELRALLSEALAQELSDDTGSTPAIGR